VDSFEDIPRFHGDLFESSDLGSQRNSHPYAADLKHSSRLRTPSLAAFNHADETYVLMGHQGRESMGIVVFLVGAINYLNRDFL